MPYCEILAQKDQVESVSLGPICLQSYPCQHYPTFKFKDGSEEELTSCISARTIAEDFADKLSPFEFFHTRDYISRAEQQRITPQMVALIVNDPQFKCISIRRHQNCYTFKDGQEIPYVKICGLVIHYTDNSIRYLEILPDAEVVEYFGQYFDDEARNAPEYAVHMRPKLPSEVMFYAPPKTVHQHDEENAQERSKSSCVIL